MYMYHVCVYIYIYMYIYTHVMLKLQGTYRRGNTRFSVHYCISPVQNADSPHYSKMD